MATDIWNYPDTEAVFSPTAAHERIVWLSLQSLASFWESYPVFDGCLTEVRVAARAALVPYQLGQTQEPAETRFEAVLATYVQPAKAQDVAAFMGGLQQLLSLELIGPWRNFFGQNQHQLSVEGLRPEIAELLAGCFRGEVIRVKKDREELLRNAVADINLSDWDLAIHAYYGLNYYSTDQFDKSVVLAGLNALTDATLFNTFLRERIVTLAVQEQDALLHAVRKSWIEISEADPIAAMKGLVVDGEAEAARIPPAAHLIVYL